MTEPSKPRALTYTEMMNGGRQQLELKEHIREQKLKQALQASEAPTLKPPTLKPPRS